MSHDTITAECKEAVDTACVLLDATLAELATCSANNVAAVQACDTLRAVWQAARAAELAADETLLLADDEAYSEAKRKTDEARRQLKEANARREQTQAELARATANRIDAQAALKKVQAALAEAEDKARQWQAELDAERARVAAEEQANAAGAEMDIDQEEEAEADEEQETEAEDEVEVTAAVLLRTAEVCCNAHGFIAIDKVAFPKQFVSTQFSSLCQLCDRAKPHPPHQCPNADLAMRVQDQVMMMLEPAVLVGKMFALKDRQTVLTALAKAAECMDQGRVTLGDSDRWQQVAKDRTCAYCYGPGNKDRHKTEFNKCPVRILIAVLTRKLAGMSVAGFYKKGKRSADDIAKQPPVPVPADVLARQPPCDDDYDEIISDPTCAPKFKKAKLAPAAAAAATADQSLVLEQLASFIRLQAAEIQAARAERQTLLAAVARLEHKLAGLEPGPRDTESDDDDDDDLFGVHHTVGA